MRSSCERLRRGTQRAFAETSNFVFPFDEASSQLWIEFCLIFQSSFEALSSLDMRAMERFRSWYKRTATTENSQSDESVHSAKPVVSCISCLPRSKSNCHYEMRKAADPNAGALADIKASNRKTHPQQKGFNPKVVVFVHFHFCPSFPRPCVFV